MANSEEPGSPQLEDAHMDSILLTDGFTEEQLMKLLERSNNGVLKKEELHLDQDRIQECTQALQNCDFLLIATGAGFSADSGLPTYPGVAEIPVYQKAGLTYRMICQPDVMQDPPLFYGFWGDCTNMYRETQPHEGYKILQEWKKSVNENCQAKDNFGNLLDYSTTPAESILVDWLKEVIKPFASGSDGTLTQSDFYKLAVKSFPTEEEEERVRISQVASQYTVNDMIVFFQYQEQHSHREFILAIQRLGFDGNLSTKMITEFGKYEPSATSIDLTRAPFFSLTSNVDAHFWVQPHNYFHRNEVSQIHGSVEHWQCQDPTCCPPWYLDRTFKFNVDKETMNASEPYVRCPKCGLLARPNVLMFGDYKWIDDYDHDKFDHWAKAVDDTMWLDDDLDLRICVIEIGCGMRVPSIRQRVSDLARCFGEKCTVIRINPDLECLETWRKNEANYIALKGYGLQTMKKINEKVNFHDFRKYNEKFNYEITPIINETTSIQTNLHHEINSQNLNLQNTFNNTTPPPTSLSPPPPSLINLSTNNDDHGSSSGGSSSSTNNTSSSSLSSSNHGSSSGSCSSSSFNNTSSSSSLSSSISSRSSELTNEK